MRIQTIFNKTYLTLKDEYNRVPSFQLQIYAKSGEGKGMFEEALVETWQSLTN